MLPPRRPLCRTSGHTCATCCHGEAVARPTLERALRRQTRLFALLVGDRPARTRLLWFEFCARRGADLLWGFLLLLPVVSDLLRPWLKRQTTCAFLGFEDKDQVGCLLHPARWNGLDRRHLAFALRPGFGCGPADYLCLAAHRFAHASQRSRERFLQKLCGLDWFAFGEVVRRENALDQPLAKR